jgi:hypothetical protein
VTPLAESRAENYALDFTGEVGVRPMAGAEAFVTKKPKNGKLNLLPSGGI